MAWVLKNNPNWHAAAQSLIDGCSAVETDEHRVRLLERLCISLGSDLYPAFLNILCVVGEFGDERAKILVAQTLVHALTTGRLPSGKLSAWGAGSRNSSGAIGQTRGLGPIEYLCASYAQPDGNQSVSATAFYRIAYTIVSLISIEPRAKSLYCAKLRADVDDPIEGALTQPTRLALNEMVQVWESGASSEDVVSCFQNALSGGGLSQLATHSSSFFR